jgi:heme exporter protein A
LLEVVDLECSRGDRPLFSGLSFSLKQGELLHIVGSNGSGKTTLLRTLCGLSRPSAGEVRWRGSNVRSDDEGFRQNLTYVGHHDGIQGDLTPEENLQVAACWGGRQTSGSISDSLERLGLAAYRRFPAKILSQGQKRRLGLARLPVTQKSLWVLDEPFTALDTRSSLLITELIAEHITGGGMAVLTSHQQLGIQVSSILRISLDP